MTTLIHWTRAMNGSEIRAVISIGVLFFIFGFVTWLNGPLITFVKLTFDLDDLNALLVLMAFYLSYFFLALPSSMVLRRIGMKKGMAFGLLVMAIGAVVFGQFTAMRQYPGALIGLFVIGAGLSLLQTASNPYISILGPIESAARRIAFMGICNKFAGFLAPFAFGALVLHGLDDFDVRVKAAPTQQARDALLDAFARQVYGPYMIMAGLLALWIARSGLPDLKTAASNDSVDLDDAKATGISGFPHLWLGVLALFLYVGVEVLAGDAIGVYGAGFSLPLDQARFFTSYTLFAMLIGYVAGLLVIPGLISQQGYLAVSAALGVVLSIGAYLTSGLASVGFIASLGFANAMMWPAIFPIGDPGPRPPHRNGLRVSDHGHRRWRADAVPVRAVEAAHRFSTGLPVSRRTELFVHSVLRGAGVENGASRRQLNSGSTVARFHAPEAVRHTIVISQTLCGVHLEIDCGNRRPRGITEVCMYSGGQGAERQDLGHGWVY